jgi:hypothetical protein
MNRLRNSMRCEGTPPNIESKSSLLCRRRESLRASVARAKATKTNEQAVAEKLSADLALKQRLQEGQSWS